MALFRAVPFLPELTLLMSVLWDLVSLVLSFHSILVKLEVILLLLNFFYEYTHVKHVLLAQCIISFFHIILSTKLHTE